MKKVIGLSVVLVIVQVAHAADIEAGKEMAATVCAACHGANGVSVSEHIPNLAGQRTGYLEAQLKAFKDGTR
ncbi:MAG: c-type cytochrome, partial [Pseudolabrys sp.]